MQCGVPQVLLALSGHGDPHDLLRPELTGVQLAPPDAKGRLGQDLAHIHNSANFTLQWDSDRVKPQQVSMTVLALEEAWTVLIEELDWALPVSADQYLVRVELDPDYSWTGYTVPVAHAQYPDGVPVITLNTSYTSSPAFYRSLAAHEFHHAVQFALRTDYDRGPEESWYWEASSEWAAELALPQEDAYAAQSRYYAEATGLRYSSMAGFHGYGMFLLNAALHEQAGPEAMRQVWELSEQRSSSLWDSILVEGTGVEIEPLWADFTVAVGNGTLREAALYTAVETTDYEEGVSGSLPYLGTHYYTVLADAHVEASGTVLLAAPAGFGSEVDVVAGEVLAVSGLDPLQNATYTLSGQERTGGPGCGGCGSRSGGPWWVAVLILAISRARLRA